MGEIYGCGLASHLKSRRGYSNIVKEGPLELKG